MKKRRNFHTAKSRTGFTLIEMIGVMAIMAILAAVVVPNGLKAIDRASVNAEQKTLSNLGGEVRKYLHDFGSPPATNTWASDISTYSDIGQLDIATNTRQMNRLYFLDPDPTAFHMRAMILSSMRQGMTLPTTLTTAQFDALWRTIDGTTPSAVSWNGWTAFAADYLVIERVNFKADYQSIVLSNSSASSSPTTPIVAYEVRSSKGTLLQSGTVQSSAPFTSVTLSLVQNVRVNVYAGPTATGNVDLTYVVNTNPKQIDFKNLHWSLQ